MVVLVVLVLATVVLGGIFGAVIWRVVTQEEQG